MSHATVRLSEICTFRHGGTPSKANPSYWGGDIPWISPKDMKSSLLSSSEDTITSAGVRGSATSIVPANAILIVARSGILAHTLPVARAGRALAFNQDIKAIQVSNDKVIAEYVYWFLRSKEREVLTRGVKKGATVHSLRSGYLENLEIPLLALHEQQRIVDLLSRAENIVRMRREAERKAKEIIPALFLDMFGDPATNPKGWETANLGDLADIQGGLQVTRSRANLPLEVPYLRVANVHRTHLDLSEIKTIRTTAAELARTQLKADDLLVIEGHGNPAEVGRVGIWTGAVSPCSHQNHLIRVRCTTARVRPLYVWASLNSAGGRQALLRQGKTTSGLNTISVSNVKSVPLQVPPIRLQQAFSLRINGLAALQTSQNSASQSTEWMFQSLLSGVFGGGTDP